MVSTSRDSSSPPSRPSHSSGRILAIDYGRRRIGLALSDELRLTAQPLATLERKNRREDLHRLGEMIRQHDVRKILVGRPLHLNGSAGEMAAEAARFAARIARELGVAVELVDERLTSWEAEQTVAETRGRSGKTDKRGALDDVAAAVILREYLERKESRTAQRRENR